MDTEPHDIMQILKEFNQEYVLSFWNDLTDEEKNILANQVRSIDFAKMNMLYYNSTLDDSISYDRISPISYIDRLNLTKDELKHYSDIGNSVINSGKLAIITLAGGQGTRLGYKGPKGSYEIDVPPKKSLFEFACDNLKKLLNETGTALNWYIMTSPANDVATKEYFEAKNYFGYPKEKVKFFMQSTLPLIDVKTKVILETPYSITTGSNGNGDVFKSLANAGFIEKWKQKILNGYLLVE